MAKILRKTQKIYASSAGATGITEYGSPASGTPAYSTDLDDIQTSAWETGWSAAALAGTEIPTFQDFNAIHYVFANQVGYILQEGIPEYDAGTEYHQFSVVKKTGTYELYGSKTNTNQGNALPSQTDNTDWQYLGSLADLGNNTTPDASETVKGIVELATNAETTTGTDTTRAITAAGLASFAKSFSSNGYTRLPGGVIIQWGNTGSFNGSTTVTFPVSFPNACLQAISGTKVSDDTAELATYTTSYSNSQMTISSDTSTSTSLRWIAIGH